LEHVQQRLPSLLDQPILFAHRGAKAYAPENTIEAFRLALRLGATGLESDVWLTADGVAVLDHDGIVRRGSFKKVPIGSVNRVDLPGHIPSLVETLEACGSGFHLSLDLKVSAAGRVVIDTVRTHAPDLLPNLWLCDHSVDALAALRPYDTEVKLVNSTRLERITEGSERRAARLAELKIDGINMRGPDWNGGLVTLFHRFGLTAFSWDLQHEHLLRPAFRMGIDGVYCDYADRMVDAFTAELGSPGRL
jgi:glycerophosphoryl diester phosphodiesterase